MRITYYEEKIKEEKELSISHNIYTRSYYLIKFLKDFIYYTNITYINIPEKVLINPFQKTDFKKLLENHTDPNPLELIWRSNATLCSMGTAVWENSNGKKYRIFKIKINDSVEKTSRLINAACYESSYNHEDIWSGDVEPMDIGIEYPITIKIFKNGEMDYEIHHPKDDNTNILTKMSCLFNYKYSLKKLSQQFHISTENVVDEILKLVKGKDLVNLFELYLSYRTSSIKEAKTYSMRYSDTPNGIITNYIKLEIFKIKRELNINYQNLKKAISENDYVFINTHENILIEEANYLSKITPILNQINGKLYNVNDPLFELFIPTINEYKNLITKIYNQKSKNSYNMIDDNEKKELVNSLFIVMDATVLEEINNNPMKGTPLEGLHLHNVINELTNSYKEKIREIANKLPVEITDNIVMEASNMVYDKYLE